MYGTMVKFTGTVVENLKCVTEQIKGLEFKIMSDLEIKGNKTMQLIHANTGGERITGVSKDCLVGINGHGSSQIFKGLFVK